MVLYPEKIKLMRQVFSNRNLFNLIKFCMTLLINQYYLFEDINYMILYFHLIKLKFIFTLIFKLFIINFILNDPKFIEICFLSENKSENSYFHIFTHHS